MVDKISNIDEIIEEILNEPYEYAKKISINKLVEILRKLSYHYYNTEEELVPDDIFDILKEVLQSRDPNNPYLKEVGSPITKEKIKLPYFMPSLEKIKPTNEKLSQWINKYKGPYVISDKLDGISGLFTKNKNKLKLYTRGDGEYGQDISHLIPYIISKKYNIKQLPDNIVIRGELIISIDDFKKIKDEFKNARNAVAGLVNSKDFSIKVAELTQFIGYTILYPKLKILDQLNKLSIDYKFNTVYYFSENTINNKKLSDILDKRRLESKFEIDGIVVMDNSKIYDVINENPEYAFAFKTIRKDQVFDVKVIDIEWNIGKDGYLTPRVILEPTDISGVTIKYTTGYNAKFINDNKLGPGAIVKLIRSGDVIPDILEVVKQANQPKMPTIEYKWNETEVNILPKDIFGIFKDTMIIKQILYFFNQIDVKYISEGIITKLVNNGYNSIIKILKADKTNLYKIEGLGEKIINKIYDNIQEQFNNIDLATLMSASGLFGRGMGIKRMKLITDTYPDILHNKWTSTELEEHIIKIDGFDKKTANQFTKNFNKFISFIKELETINYINVDHIINKKTNINTQGIFNNMKIVFTGFRNKDWENFVISNGGIITDSVSKNTNLVVYTDTDSTKYLKAVQLKIPLIQKQDFQKKYNI